MQKGGVIIKATKIRMHDGMEESNSVLEIKDIYIKGAVEEKFYPKENVHDFIDNNPDTPVKVEGRPVLFYYVDHIRHIDFSRNNYFYGLDHFLNYIKQHHER